MLTSLFTFAALAQAAVAAPLLSQPTQGVSSQMSGKCLALTGANLAQERQQLQIAGTPPLIPAFYTNNFTPRTTVAIYFNNQLYSYGDSNTTPETLFAPQVYFPAPADDDGQTTYTLIMADPDASLVLSNPAYLHWVRRGLRPGCNGAAPSTGGRDVRLYLSPTPPPLSGAHRYTVTILKEPKTGYNPTFLEAQLNQATFSVVDFANKNNAQIIGANYFNQSAAIGEPGESHLSYMHSCARLTCVSLLRARPGSLPASSLIITYRAKVEYVTVCSRHCFA